MISRLDALARVGVEAGCNLAAGQPLIMIAPIEATPLVRAIAQAAWRRGAADVSTVFDDPDLLRLRLQWADDVAVASAPVGQMLATASDMASGAARLSLLAPRPDLLEGIDTDRILRAHRGWGEATERANALLGKTRPVDTALPFATEAWARVVFSDLEPHAATARLWDALAIALRLDVPDPVAAWRMHLAALESRSARLESLALRALRLSGTRTDLIVPLAAGRTWRGGLARTSAGRAFAPVLPVEGVSTLVSDGASGHIAFSRPIALAGEVVEGLEAEVAEGTVTRISARRGGAVLERLLDGEARARRISRIALVDHTAPTARLGIDLFNPLLDACCASHLTFGAAASGASEGSALHIDAMFGDAATNVDGLDAEGCLHPLMREGSFVI